MDEEKIYLNQTDLRFTAQTGVTLTGATGLLIKYIKPDGTTGQWVGTISGTQDIYYDFSDPSGLDQLDWWTLWGYAIAADGREVAGIAYKIRVWKQGQ